MSKRTDPYLVVHYTRGHAFYLAKVEDWKAGGDITIWHLISGDPFEARCGDLERAEPQNVPKGYLLDAQAYNPMLAYCLPEDYRIELEVQRFGLQGLLDEIQELANGIPCGGDDMQKDLKALHAKYTKQLR